MALSNECNWKSDICPHHVYNFTNITEKSKVEGRQSRFLGIYSRNGSYFDAESSRTDSQTIRQWTLLRSHSILGWNKRSEQVPRCGERHGRKMKNMRSAVGMVMVKEEEETDDNITGLSENQPTSPPSVAYLKRYLMKNWYKFRKLDKKS